MSQLSFIRDNVYNLKQDYGRPADLYKATFVEDITTGVKVVTRRVIHLSKLIMLPSIEDLVTKYTQAFLKSNRQFSYSGYVQAAKKIAILDLKDIPLDFEVRKEDYIIVQERSRPHRFDIKGVHQYEGKYAYILQLAETEGVEIEQVFTQNVYDSTLVFQDLANAG
jgi:hypothetical protein